MEDDSLDSAVKRLDLALGELTRTWDGLGQETSLGLRRAVMKLETVTNILGDWHAVGDAPDVRSSKHNGG